MFRVLLSFGLAAIVLVGAGCRMCCHPYDYSGPVYDRPGCSSSYVSSTRVAPPVASTPQLSATPIQRQAPMETQFGVVPGSERILSVTEHVVDPSAVSEPPVLAESSTDIAQPLPSKGWTARHSTLDVRR